jgi:hypothetical protein
VAGRSVTPGYVVVYPNRGKSSAKMTKAVVGLIMLVSVGLMVIITIGGWSELEGLQGVNVIVCLLYVTIAFFVWTRWARGLLPIAAAFAVLMLLLAIVAGTGLAGTSWFNRSHFGFAPAKSVFGSKGFPPDFLGLLTVLLIPVQILLIFFTMLGFSQGWNVEKEVPKEEAEGKGKDKGSSSSSSSSSAEPATA